MMYKLLYQNSLKFKQSLSSVKLDSKLLTYAGIYVTKADVFEINPLAGVQTVSYTHLTLPTNREV